LNWKPQGYSKAVRNSGHWQDRTKFSLKGKDVSNGYILLATACDGTLATTAQFTSIRVVCNNTLAIALKGQNNSAGVVKVRTVPSSMRESQTAIGDFSPCMG
jgi:hypothetical protein